MFIIIQVRIFLNLFLDINVNRLSSSTYKFIAEKMMEISKGNIKTSKKQMETI